MNKARLGEPGRGVSPYKDLVSFASVDDILKVGLSIYSKEDVDRQSKMSIPRLKGIGATNGTKEKAKSSGINRGILLFPLF